MGRHGKCDEEGKGREKERESYCNLIRIIHIPVFHVWIPLRVYISAEESALSIHSVRLALVVLCVLFIHPAIRNESIYTKIQLAQWSSKYSNEMTRWTEDTCQFLIYLIPPFVRLRVRVCVSEETEWKNVTFLILGNAWVLKMRAIELIEYKVRDDDVGVIRKFSLNLGCCWLGQGQMVNGLIRR